MSWTELITLLIMDTWRTLTGRNKLERGKIDLTFLEDPDEEEDEKSKY